MTGEEWFEFAAAIAGVSMGLVAILVLAVVAIVGAWRLVRQASDAQQAAARSAATVEDLVHRLATSPSEGGAAGELQQQVESLALQQRQLQDSVRVLVDSAVGGADQERAVIGELAMRVGRLDTNVGQMATSLANLIRLLEKQRE